MFWGIHKTDTMPSVLQELCAGGHIEQNAGLAFLTQYRFYATEFRHAFHQRCGFVGVELVCAMNTHFASGSVDTVARIGATKSSSVRVSPRVGLITLPVATSKLAINVCVPCRAYSNSIRSNPITYMGQ